MPDFMLKFYKYYKKVFCYAEYKIYKNARTGQ